MLYFLKKKKRLFSQICCYFSIRENFTNTLNYFIGSSTASFSLLFISGFTLALTTLRRKKDEMIEISIERRANRKVVLFSMSYEKPTKTVIKEVIYNSETTLMASFLIFEFECQIDAHQEE